MATTKITPVNPDTKTTTKPDDKITSRKTAGMRFPRKTGRKTAGFKIGGG